MRVRAIFWLLLLCTCLGILGFAFIIRPAVPAVVQTTLKMPSSATDMTMLLLHVTDNQGMPVDGAQVQSNAYMTNMVMQTDKVSITDQSHGNYLVHLHLYMAGPWAIAFSVRATGFSPCHKTLYIQVT
jgi:hypothetical protein